MRLSNPRHAPRFSAGATRRQRALVLLGLGRKRKQAAARQSSSFVVKAFAPSEDPQTCPAPPGNRTHCCCIENSDDGNLYC
jgi:hypothetical protein